MLQRIIPATGEPLPSVGLGTYGAFDIDASDTQRRGPQAVLGTLVASGGKLVDSSPLYGRAEGVVGDLQASLSLRPQLFLATKVWTSGREAGIHQMERSLALMRTATMDLMQVHNLVDWRTHTATLKAWKEQGRVRDIGVTHYHAGAHADLEKLLRASMKALKSGTVPGMLIPLRTAGRPATRSYQR
jgi:diketogulonate reductase-like aldo/keto reductase